MALSVVHFSTTDGEGGSARSAYRIHSNLRRRGHRSRMLVRDKLLDDPDVETVSGNDFTRRCDELANRISWRFGLPYQLVPSTFRVLRHPWLASPDIIQLFNTHGGYFATWMLPALSRRAPLVWRLSDMWPVTGHCAYSGPCDRWKTGCGACPDLSTYPAIGIDTTAMLWRQKSRLYGKMRMTVVAPSSWIEQVARTSPLLAGADIHLIPNGLDLNLWRPLPPNTARERLNVPQDRIAILFAPHVASGNTRKGSDLFEAALHRLGRRDDVVVLIAGIGAEQWIGRVPQQVIALGYLRDAGMMAMANAASDFVVVPSAVENLPNGVLEAFACERPVVAFDTGGIKDAVHDGDTGLLVPTSDIGALADALSRLIADGDGRRRMGARALAMAKREYSEEVEAGRLESLYMKLLNR